MPQIGSAFATFVRDRKVTRFAGIVGPFSFVSAWIIGSVMAETYSVSDNAISQLASVSAPTRWLMTAGFVIYGIAMPIFATFIREALSPGAGWATALSGIATLAVAALPLDFSASMDAAHGAAAFIAYAGIVLAPLFGGREFLRCSHRWAGITSLILAAVSCVSLIASIVSSDNGLFQRIGLTLGDIWFLAIALLLSQQRVRQLGGPTMDDSGEVERVADVIASRA